MNCVFGVPFVVTPKHFIKHITYLEIIFTGTLCSEVERCDFHDKPARSRSHWWDGKLRLVVRNMLIVHEMEGDFFIQIVHEIEAKFSH